MSNPKDRAPNAPPPADDSKRSGRAGLDERGNSVWEWRLETGVYSRDISTQKLRKLDLGDLSIAETAKHQSPAGRDEKAEQSRKDQRSKAGGGFNPYDSAGNESTGGNPYDNARNTARKTQAAPPSAATARKPMDLKRLDEWLAIKKRIDQEKKDDDE